MKVKRIIALGCLLAITQVSTISSFASTNDKIQSNKDKINSLNSEKNKLEGTKSDVNSEILALVKQIESKQGELDSVQATVDLLQSEINSLQNSIVDTSREISETEEKITKTEETYKEKEKEQQYQEDVLSNRIKRNYINNTYNEFLGILLDSESISEVLFKFKYVNKVLNNDREIIEDLKEIKIELANTKADLDLDKKKLDSDKISLETQQKSIKEKQEVFLTEKASLDKEMDALQAIENEKQAKIQSIMRSQTYLDNQIQDLVSENNSMSQEMGDVSSGSGGGDYASGSFIKPTSGRYTSPYGPRVHPVTGKQSFHTGVDIANGYGTAIVSADGGKIVKAGYSGAYGNRIIVDHGNGYSTMYAHMQAFNVSTGSTVSKGQKIGEMGSTGMSTGPHLHYEVWYKGQHQNPRNYIP